MNNKIFRHFFTNYAPLIVPAFFLADCNGGSWFPATGQKLRHYQIIKHTCLVIVVFLKFYSTTGNTFRPIGRSLF